MVVIDANFIISIASRNDIWDDRIMQNTSWY